MCYLMYKITGRQCTRERGSMRQGNSLKGKHKDWADLHCWIPAGQERYLAKVVEITGKSKGQLVSEGIQLLLNNYKQAGVL